MNIKHSEYLIQATVFSHSTCIPLSFLSEGLLVRDQRMVERKKPGQKKARKKFTWCVRYRCMFSVYFSLSSQGKAVINVLLDSMSSVKILLLYNDNYWWGKPHIDHDNVLAVHIGRDPCNAYHRHFNFSTAPRHVQFDSY